MDDVSGGGAARPGPAPQPSSICLSNASWRSFPGHSASHRGRFVAYYRVSTAGQALSGLGLEAQQAAVQNYLDGGTWELVGEFTEVESGRKSERPALAEALAL